MFASVLALLVWTSPHTPCVVAQPYDGAGVLPEAAWTMEEVVFFDGEAQLRGAPDRQSATVCAPPEGERTA